MALSCNIMHDDTRTHIPTTEYTSDACSVLNVSRMDGMSNGGCIDTVEWGCAIPLPSTDLRRTLRSRRLRARWLLSLALSRRPRRGTACKHSLHRAPHCAPTHLALHCLLLFFEHPLEVLLVRADVGLFLLVL